jgi:hypothetical protein
MFEKNFVSFQTNIAIFYFKNLKTSENDYSRPIQVSTCAEGGVGGNAHRAAKNGAAVLDYLYVFNIDGGGYVIVSGDDRTEEILGYSTTGTFDADKIPDNMRAFLQEYVDGIKYLDDHDIQVTRTSRRAPGYRDRIEPLLTTRWDQWAPYNIYCPQITEEERGLTGCVATAMAQLRMSLSASRKTTALVLWIPG